MEQKMEDAPVVVIFGASGDLTQRKLGPALHSLACAGLLPAETKVLGVARSELSDEEFRDRLYEGVVNYARLKPDEDEDHVAKPEICKDWPRFAGRFSYLAGEYDDPETYERLAHRLETLRDEDADEINVLYYLAVPPLLYPVVVEQLGKAGLNKDVGGWKKNISEKPFGHDLQSAQKLNDQIHPVFREDQVYRIDHYLGKETVQNLLAFRFANAIFEPIWGRNYVRQVQITVSEDIGVGHRGSYYDQAGVLRDMLQNHLLQLLALTAMEAPVAVNARSLRDEKVKVLQAVRDIDRDDVVLGQYQGYRDEPNVADDSMTPTYVALRLYIDNWRWQGVPFYLRTGKNLGRKLTQVTLEFKEVPHLLFPENASLAPNTLSFDIQPNEGIHLQFGIKVPGAGMRVSPVDMTFHYDEHFGQKVLPEAYERLLLDAIQGDASLFTRSDEIEAAWRLVDPLLGMAEERNVPLPIYKPGNGGPAEAERLLDQRDGGVWYQKCALPETEKETV